MKRLIIYIMMTALMLGTTQCKRDVKEITPNNNSVNITLDVGGVKNDVNPETGVVSFEDGDEILVANDGVYVGKLTYDDGVFSGTITNPCDEDYLHFYHLGNRDVGELTEGGDSECYVSIADQTLSLPVISYGHSIDKYSSDVSTYTALLRNKCALVKFDVTTLSDYAGVVIKGFNNKVYVDFSVNSIDYIKEGDGNITLSSHSGVKWAILLPQSELPEGEQGSACSGAYEGIRGGIPEINENDYLADGITVTVETKVVPEGARVGLFTIAPNKQVHFAKGNLVYNKNTKVYYFYDNQYERAYIGNLPIGENYSNWSIIEHFGWGCSGFNHGATIYQPWITQKPNSSYYAYGDIEKNLYDETGIADCGYNAISNGGDAYKQWRTLSLAELNYLFYTRDDAADKYSYATVSDGSDTYPGLVILPDNWTDPYENCFTPGIVNNFATQQYSESQWAQMEAGGALFLPCNGRRNAKATIGVALVGFYWTSNPYDANKSYCVLFSDSDGLDVSHVYDRFNGMALRLAIE